MAQCDWDTKNGERCKRRGTIKVSSLSICWQHEDAAWENYYDFLDRNPDY